MATPTNTNQNWRFGVYEVDVRDAELRRDGTPVKMREQSFRILVYLLEHAGEIVTREELRRVLWSSDTFVDFDHSLNTAVMKLRDALGDSADAPLYIETIPKRGYRFIAPVSQPADVQTGVAHSSGNSASPPLVAQSSKSHGRSKKLLLPAFVIGVLVLVAVGWILERSFTNWRVPSHTATSSNMRIVPLTSLPGAARGPAFSPDGKQIAFLWNAETPAKWNLYVQLVGGENPLQLTHTTSGFLCCADWSFDGSEIAFSRCDDHGGGVFVVPALGGPERKLTDAACGSTPKWTADGKSLVLADRCRPDGPTSIVLFSLATGQKRCLHAPLPGDAGDGEPALSPDQKTVAFLRALSVYSVEIYTVSLAGGEVRQLTQDGHGIRHLMWSADGKRLIFESDRNGSPRVWQIPATGGAIEPETVYPQSGALSRDGRRLAFVDSSQSSYSFTVWRAELSHAGGHVVSQTRLLASAGLSGAAQFSPDGQQIVFQSSRSGRLELWKSDANGGNQVQLTSFDRGVPGTPRWSPDGKWIAFDYYGEKSEKSGNIYVIDVEGRNLRHVTSGDYKRVVPSWSRDGLAIYFASNVTGDWQVWRHELSTGQETQITHHGGFAAFEAYDAKTLYYTKFSGGGIWSVPVEGGTEQNLTETPHLGYWGHFAVADSGLYLVDSSTEPGPTIFYYDFQHRRLTPALMLKQNAQPGAAGLSSSRDGRTLIYTQFESRSSIMMAENFQ